MRRCRKPLATLWFFSCAECKWDRDSAADRPARCAPEASEMAPWGASTPRSRRRGAVFLWGRTERRLSSRRPRKRVHVQGAVPTSPVLATRDKTRTNHPRSPRSRANRLHAAHASSSSHICGREHRAVCAARAPGSPPPCEFLHAGANRCPARVSWDHRPCEFLQGPTMRL